MTGAPTPRPDRCRMMGILNVTPDSFSDGGRHRGRDAAVRHGLELRAQGADVIDVGGESTRPGAGRVPAEEELLRVVPVVAELVAAGARVSVDTSRRTVAQAAVAAGAVMVNDVSGGDDPDMVPFVAESGVEYVVVHSRGPSIDMAARATYSDVVSEVLDELEVRVERAVEIGVLPERIVVDPGLGFAKRPEHDWQLLAALTRLDVHGLPVLVGASRKSFLSRVGGVPGAVDAAGNRDDVTAAVTALAAEAGMWGVRVHDVARSARAARVGDAVRASRQEITDGVRTRASWRMTWAS